MPFISRHILHFAVMGTAILPFCCVLPVQAQAPTTRQSSQSVRSLDLQALLDEAKAKKLSQITIPAGTYRVTMDTVQLSDLSNFTLNGTGVTLLFPNPSKWAVSTSGCNNLTLRGLTIDYDQLPFTQATITEKAPDSMWFKFRVHDGYPRLGEGAFPKGKQIHAFDKTSRNWKLGVGDLYGEIKVVSPSEGRVDFTYQPGGLDKLNVGDYLVFNTRGSGAFDIKSSENLRMEDVTILTSPGLGFSSRHVNGATFVRCVVKRGPRPLGATEDRLLSTGADAFNFADSRQGPTLEKCDFSYMGDDSVNLHGLSWPVVKVEGNTVWTAIFHGPRNFSSDFLPGDEARFMSPDNFEVRSTSTLVSWENAPRSFNLEIPPDQWKQLWPQRTTITPPSFYKVVLKDASNVKVGEFFDFPAANAPKFVIRDSYFHDHRARGLRLQSSDGLIENNRFERLKGAAIAIGPELVYWREAGWPTRVTIRGNTIKDVGQGANIIQSSSFTPGAISLYTRIEKPDTQTFSSEIRDVQILDNIIDGSSVAGIHINAAQNVTVRGNRISNVNTEATARTGSEFKLNSSSPITVQNSKNVQVENNTVAASKKS